jgi:hypothetical protein
MNLFPFKPKSKVPPPPIVVVAPVKPNEIATASGRFDFANPQAVDVYAQDIILGLSRTFRFRGMTNHPYTVAQHSILVAMLALHEAGICEPEQDMLRWNYSDYSERLCQLAVLHDASEAYMSDISTPLKRMLPEYKIIEAEVQEVIFSRFGLVPTDDDHRIIAIADAKACLIERDFLMPWDKVPYGIEHMHPKTELSAYFSIIFDPVTARQHYSDLFHDLFPMVGGHVH